MNKYKVYSEEIKNMPWEERPKDCDSVVWRSKLNPIVKRNPVKDIARIFNSAVVPWEDGTFIGVFRAETVHTLPHMRVGRSKDGINWVFEEKQLEMVDE
ncbi:MAG: hypothetical protein WCY80_04470, partial [Candidatus Izemoplasmatales bacterium]